MDKASPKAKATVVLEVGTMPGAHILWEPSNPRPRPQPVQS